MKKPMAKNWVRFYLLAVVLLWALVALWALTEREPPEGRGYYGNVMTIRDQGSADLFGVEGPGVYVVNRNHKPVTAVRGGLGMILRGLASGDGDQVSVGGRGVQAGLFSTASGVCLLILAGVSALGWIPLALREKRAAGEQPSTNTIREDQKRSGI